MFPMNGTVFELGTTRLAASAVRLSNWVESPRTIWGATLLPPGVRLARRIAEALLRRRCSIRVAGDGVVCEKIRPGGGRVAAEGLVHTVEFRPLPMPQSYQDAAHLLLELALMLAPIAIARHVAGAGWVERPLSLAPSGRTLPHYCLAPRLLAQRPQTARG